MESQFHKASINEIEYSRTRPCGYIRITSDNENLPKTYSCISSWFFFIYFRHQHNISDEFNNAYIPYEKLNRIPLVVQLDKDRSQCGI